MPLREDLLVPIAGENPSGEDLYYDRAFDQIKEARREDLENTLAGNFEWSQKKADHRAVVKLAGEALANKSKDLRLVGWLAESHLRLEGFPVLAPSIELLRAVQETFWPTLYPVIEEGDDLELRMLAVETAGRLIAEAVRKVHLTRSGLSFEDYQESRAVGYEKDATSDARLEARKDAIDHGRLTAEEFDEAFATSPKSLYAEADKALAESLEATERLDQYGQETYASNAPNLQKLREGLEEVRRVVDSLLNERRKTEPDPVAAVAPEAGAADQAQAAQEAAEAPAPGPVRLPAASSTPLGGAADAYALVVQCAEFLFDRDPRSPVPYLVCAGLRFGEARMQGPTPVPGFAVGPSSEIRHSLRTMASKEAWKELLRGSLPILASECARAWLDLHRYIWRAAQETGATALAEAVVGTVKSLLMVRPELRHWTLEDDTGAANPETQQWLDATVLQ